MRRAIGAWFVFCALATLVIVCARGSADFITAFAIGGFTGLLYAAGIQLWFRRRG